MEEKSMTEGCLKNIYRSKEQRVAQAVLTRDGFTIILSEKQLCMLSMILKFLFSP
ncbi:MAG TPA: hypothetical protein PLP17_15970 [Oligoflexia bacterium]|nr:hypothetical protein [Oligoflexia bacterium]